MKLKPSLQGEATNASDLLGQLFYRRVHRFLTLGVGSEFASLRLSSSSVFAGSDRDRLGFELAARFFTEQAAQDFRG